MNSSIIFGGSPAASTRDGDSINVGGTAVTLTTPPAVGRGWGIKHSSWESPPASGFDAAGSCRSHHCRYERLDHRCR
jgi:hypothetical protein